MKRSAVLTLGMLGIASFATIGVIAALASSAQVKEARPREVTIRRDPGPCPPITITSPSPLPPATVGGDYHYKIEASGGLAPVKFGQYQSDPATGAIKAFMPDSHDPIGPYTAEQMNLYAGDADLYYWAGTPGYTGPPVRPSNPANKYWKLDGLYLRSSTGEIIGQPKMSGHFEILIVAVDKCNSPTHDTLVWKYFHLEITQ
jgi:hypothetical protein